MTLTSLLLPSPQFNPSPRACALLLPAATSVPLFLSRCVLSLVQPFQTSASSPLSHQPHAQTGTMQKPLSHSQKTTQVTQSSPLSHTKRAHSEISKCVLLQLITTQPNSFLVNELTASLVVLVKLLDFSSSVSHSTVGFTLVLRLRFFVSASTFLPSAYSFLSWLYLLPPPPPP